MPDREMIKLVLNACLMNASTDVPPEEVEDAIYRELQKLRVLTNTTEVVVNSQGAHVVNTTFGSISVPLLEGQKIETPVQEYAQQPDTDVDGYYWTTSVMQAEVVH